MSNKTRTLLPIVLLVTMLASGCKATSSPGTTNIGNRAIDFELQTLDGKAVKLSDYRGKPVLLNFWATWCGPCRFEVPFLQQINDSYSAKGLVMLAVDIGENSTVINNFMTSLNVSLPVLMDTDKKASKSYTITAIPTTFLIDKDGIIRQKVLGAFPDKATIENELKKIIP
jgi:cytochrome c biogenesis protein CcmG/thiol:disulfide interchange protein DsbE